MQLFLFLYDMRMHPLQLSTTALAHSHTHTHIHTHTHTSVGGLRRVSIAILCHICTLFREMLPLGKEYTESLCIFLTTTYASTIISIKFSIKKEGRQ